MRKHINFKDFEKIGSGSKTWGKKCGNGSKIWGNGPKILGNPSKIFQWKKAEMDLKFWKIEQKKRKLSKSDFWGISEKFREIVEINKKWVIWLVSAYFR